MATYLTPALAWQRLRDGNKRFVAGTSSHPNQDASRRSSLVENVKQTSQRLVDSSRVISGAVDSGRTAVLGLAYSLADGRADLVSSIGRL